MNITERNQIINLVKHEVVPAIGCTEPIAVALCAAYATETLGCRPEKIDVHLSANVLKNAMGVGIPGTGMIGLPIAIALGALIGKTEYQLEVLKDCNPQEVERGKEMIDANCIDIKLKEGISEKLYIEVTCQANGHKATAIIAALTPMCVILHTMMMCVSIMLPQAVRQPMKSALNSLCNAYGSLQQQPLLRI